MRVHNEQLAALATNPAGKTTGVDIGAVRGAGAGAIAGDNVELSGLAGAIGQAQARFAAERMEQVRHVAALYENGRYAVNAREVGKRIVEEITASAGDRRAVEP